MDIEREGIYTVGLLEWLTFRRHFALRADATPDVINKRLVGVSQPPPVDPTPFTASISVAVAHTTMFEIHVMRGLPWGDHYSSLMATGRITEQAESEDETQTFLTGEIAPAQRGMVIYSGVVALLLLWVAAAGISAIVSPVATLVPALAAVFTTTIVCGVIYSLLLADLRRLKGVLEQLQ